MTYSYIKFIKYINIISIYTIHIKLYLLNAKIKCISFEFCLLELNFPENIFSGKLYRTAYDLYKKGYILHRK